MMDFSQAGIEIWNNSLEASLVELTLAAHPFIWIPSVLKVFISHCDVILHIRPDNGSDTCLAHDNPCYWVEAVVSMSSRLLLKSLQLLKSYCAPMGKKTPSFLCSTYCKQLYPKIYLISDPSSTFLLALCSWTHSVLICEIGLKISSWGTVKLKCG